MNARIESVCGEVSKFQQRYSLFGCSSSFWIRTHLFAMTGSAMKKLDRLSLDSCKLNNAVRLDGSGRLVWSDSVSLNLQERIEKWLYPGKGEFGWYRAKSSDPQTKLKKAHAILNEKWLAAFTFTNNILVIDCAPNVVTRFLLNVRSRFNQVVLRK